jgi:TRAP-type C4-dicarboxylate transport system permease small subunit
MSVGGLVGRLGGGLAVATTAAASICLLFMMSVVVCDVIARAIDPAWRLSGMLDIVELSLDWVVFLSIPVSIFAGKTIVVDLVDGLDRQGTLITTGLIALLVVLAVMGQETVRPALNVRAWQEVTIDLGIPKFWYWIPIWVGLGLSVIAVAIQLYRRVFD